MKPTASARSMSNVPNGHSARLLGPSPHASSSSVSRMSPSSKKTRRSTDGPRHHGFDDGTAAALTPANLTSSSSDLLFQLQQLQQQQQLHQQGMAVAAAAAFGYPGVPAIQPMGATYAPTSFISTPPAMQCMVNGGIFQSEEQALKVVYPQPSSSTASVNSSERGEDLLERIEKKDQMIAQLGSFLSQMKQESEGTANAWKEKMNEIAELKRQIVSLSQQLKDSQEKERQTAEQLAQVTEDVELAVHGLKDSEAKHLEEIKIMNDEIRRQTSEREKIKLEYEERLHLIRDAHQECEEQLRHSVGHIASLEEAIEKLNRDHKRSTDERDERCRDLDEKIRMSEERIRGLEADKQELAQHLWSVTQALDQSAAQERAAQNRLEGIAREVESKSAGWEDQLQRLEKENAELTSMQVNMQSQIQHLEARVDEERSQKEQMNALMGDEMQRVAIDIQQLQQCYDSKLEQCEVEIDHWKTEATALQEKLVHIEGQYHKARQELDDWQARATQVDAQVQELQKNGSEKASTLQEINEQLGQTLHELHTTQSQLDQLQQHFDYLSRGINACVQLVSSNGSKCDTAEESFPNLVLNALEEWKQQRDLMEQIKISMLRLQQDRDAEREKFRQREQELSERLQVSISELEGARTDAEALAHEAQQLSQRLNGSESKLSDQVQQLTKDLEEVRANSGLQILQLQKSLESHKSRVQQLESEKRELLQEAEQINSSMETLYRAKNEKQVELDQMKAMWKELQAEHADLKETMEDHEVNYQHTIEELNSKANELQGLVQELSTAKIKLQEDLDQCTGILTKLKSEHEDIIRQYSLDKSSWSEKEHETVRALDEKSHRLDEMMDMITQLRSRNEFLEQSRASEDQNIRVEFDKLQQQLIILSQEKKKLELACGNAKSQLDQLMPELFTLKEERRHLTQTHDEAEEEISRLKVELARLQSETERLSRARSALQLELNRVTDESQDVVRQFEVMRRDTKVQEKHLHDENDRIRKEIEELRNEATESTAMVEELQTKMTSVQNAANATINELMSELQTLQDAINYDKTKFQKENDALKAQLKAIDDELRRKDADVKEIQVAFRHDKEQHAEKENEWNAKISRLTAALESKKQDNERMSKELEAKGLKVAEYERKINPLLSMRDNLQAKCNELRLTLESKTKEAYDVEERFRDDLSRAIKEKRDFETMYLAMKEDCEMMKSQSSGQHHQYQSEIRTLKQNLERTKADLMRANAEVLSLSQRLETCQLNAQETIAELTTRLQSVDQQRELAVNGLQREINMERERRREAEVQKMDLQRLLRQRNAQTPSASLLSVVDSNMNQDDTTKWSIGLSTPSTQRANPSIDHQPPPSTTDIPNQEVPKWQQNVTPPEYRKFYANEPMTNAELANLPMNVIKAQIGLDLASNYCLTKSPGKTAGRIPAKTAQIDNNDDIPLLPLEKLPQNPEATDGENSPTCDSGSSSRLISENRSGAVSLLASLSARSSSDRYLVDLMDNSVSRPQRNSSNSSISSSTNNKKKIAMKKKRPSVMPSSSAAAASAYSGLSSLPVGSPSPPKMKSNSKLLPRIQQ